MKPLVAVLALSLLTAVSAGPGSAAVPDRGVECAPSAARLRPGGDAVPDRNELTPAQAAEVERELTRVLDARPEARHVQAGEVTVPVYFHVLHDGEHGDLPLERIEEQIRTLQESHDGGFGGEDTGFDFVLRGVTRTDNAAWYRDPGRHEAAFKRRLRRGGAETLNLYSADLGPRMLGWATFPWRYRNGPHLDGVVIHTASLPGGGIDGFDRGFTATHEVGHWLGLYHTFQDGCREPGDRVADTPPESAPTDGCPLLKNTCPAGDDDPVHNFMDYSHDDCMTEFTPGQAARMPSVCPAG